MKKKCLIFLLSLFTIGVNAQTRKVLLEEFTGANCGNCPMGAHTMDSLLGIYPDLIGVSLHSYQVPDAMFFPQIDTIGTAYSPGAPLGATDRIYNASWGYVADLYTNWNAAIQSQLLLPAKLGVSLNTTWNSASRTITAQISTNIIANLPSGDYRFNLYVVEDSVTGTGPGYDQENFYSTVVGNPFYGMGNPIVGYTHRHVVRAILPQAWGQAGIISAAPISGQNFTTTINYTLPIAYNENRIKLVAFVSNITTNHQGDDVLNAIEVPLQLSSGVTPALSENQFSIFPNPTNGVMVIESNDNVGEIIISNLLSEVVLKQRLEGKKSTVDISAMENGIYFITTILGENHTTQKIIKVAN